MRAHPWLSYCAGGTRTAHPSPPSLPRRFKSYTHHTYTCACPFTIIIVTKLLCAKRYLWPNCYRSAQLLPFMSTISYHNYHNYNCANCGAQLPHQPYAQLYIHFTSLLFTHVYCRCQLCTLQLHAHHPRPPSTTTTTIVPPQRPICFSRTFHHPFTHPIPISRSALPN